VATGTGIHVLHKTQIQLHT